MPRTDAPPQIAIMLIVTFLAGFFLTLALWAATEPDCARPNLAIFEQVCDGGP